MKRLNLLKSIQYIHGLGCAELDGLYFELVDKMSELSLRSDKSLANQFPANPDLQVTDKLGAIIDFVRCAKPPLLEGAGVSEIMKKDLAEQWAGCCQSIRVMHAVIRAKMHQAKYTPTRLHTDETIAAQKALEKQQTEAIKEKAAAEHAAKEKEKQDAADREESRRKRDAKKTEKAEQKAAADRQAARDAEREKADAIVAKRLAKRRRNELRAERRRRKAKAAAEKAASEETELPPENKPKE